ncbi:MAG: hypothetical protein KDA73_15865 [Rhodobacteraceae bacterium]|nr:hypothetical protein [Paracoccaceae bacterium]
MILSSEREESHQSLNGNPPIQHFSEMLQIETDVGEFRPVRNCLTDPSLWIELTGCTDWARRMLMAVASQRLKWRIIPSAIGSLTVPATSTLSNT